MEFYFQEINETPHLREFEFLHDAIVNRIASQYKTYPGMAERLLNDSLKMICPANRQYSPSFDHFKIRSKGYPRFEPEWHAVRINGVQGNELGFIVNFYLLAVLCSIADHRDEEGENINKLIEKLKYNLCFLARSKDNESANRKLISIEDVAHKLLGENYHVPQWILRDRSRSDRVYEAAIHTFD